MEINLIISKTRCPNGEDIINRKGALYLCQKSGQVYSYICSHSNLISINVSNLIKLITI